ncbi:hypothetical protein PR048_019915 [Dryococelus australis]|uniref:Uncharacterized protein n=1 Tax=Dryococelus australis TaxID=614101 RepID=A0ABQ9H4V0_9NEOP|nr:hypothetical protein PR048_019915 [Dryococelus australis]
MQITPLNCMVSLKAQRRHMQLKCIFNKCLAGASPLKRLTLPRLKLCATLLLARCLHLVLDKYSLILPLEVTCAWTNSSVVLSWIKASPLLRKTFVGNRVSEIQSCTSVDWWYHVLSEQNSASCASHGLTPAQLVEHLLWWSGPAWLCEDKKHWPQRTLHDSSPTCNEEHQTIQRQASLAQSPFVDLMKRHCLLAVLLNDELHLKFFHSGSQMMQSRLQREFWVLCVRISFAAAFINLKGCTRTSIYEHWSRLRRYSVQHHGYTQKAFVLRVYIYGCLCVLQKKAIHLELLSYLSIEAFMAAYRRFVARRGQCVNIYTYRDTHQQIVDSLAEHNITWHSTLQQLLTSVGFGRKIEAKLNSRPLCPLPSGDHDLSRWHFEDFHHLQSKVKWTSGEDNIDEGHNFTPLRSKCGRKLMIHPSTADGLIAEVRTQQGTFTRPAISCVLFLSASARTRNPSVINKTAKESHCCRKPAREISADTVERESEGAGGNFSGGEGRWRRTEEGLGRQQGLATVNNSWATPGEGRLGVAARQRVRLSSGGVIRGGPPPVSPTTHNGSSRRIGSHLRSMSSWFWHWPLVTLIFLELKTPSGIVWDRTAGPWVARYSLRPLRYRHICWDKEFGRLLMRPVMLGDHQENLAESSCSILKDEIILATQGPAVRSRTISDGTWSSKKRSALSSQCQKQNGSRTMGSNESSDTYAPAAADVNKYGSRMSEVPAYLAVSSTTNMAAKGAEFRHNDAGCSQPYVSACTSCVTRRRTARRWHDMRPAPVHRQPYCTSLYATAVTPVCRTVATNSTDRRRRVPRAALPWISSPSCHATSCTCKYVRLRTPSDAPGRWSAYLHARWRNPGNISGIQQRKLALLEGRYELLDSGGGAPPPQRNAGGGWWVEGLASTTSPLAWSPRHQTLATYNANPK